MLTKTFATLLALWAGLLFSGSKAGAQVVPAGVRQPAAGSIDTDIELLRKDLRDQKKQIVATNLPLTPDEAVKFWPLYEQYTAETIKLNDQRYGLIKEYVANYNTMTDEQASSYIKRWIGVDEDTAKLRLKYIPMIEKVLPEKKAAMFFQIDRRVGLMTELQLSSQLPLVAP